MNDEFRHMVIETLRRGEELPAEWARELFPPEKREYELVYHGKEREEDILADTMAVPLQPASTFGGNGDPSIGSGQEWRNMLIFGDNLQALKTLLEQKKAGQLCNADGTPGIRLIYIDPPFATKREFRGNQDEKAYQDKVVGATFLEFVRKRLILIRELLAPNGCLLLHCDYRKGHYLKTILDEVFGENNFRNEILVRRTQKNLQQQFDEVRVLNVAVDSIFWYSKRPEERFQRIGRAAYLEANTENWHGMYKGVDRRTMRYDLLGHNIESGQWMWKQERAYRAVENYKNYEKSYSKFMTLYEYWVETGKKLEFIRANPQTDTPEYWVAPKGIVPADSKWLDVPAYGDQKFYPTCKSEILLDRIVRHLSDPNDIVLDAFAGSGTTLAVAEKLGRRWIGIDCGKLAVYTIQKRLLNLKSDIGNKGKPLKPRPFTLYNAGLYDFSRLQQLPWQHWRFFALQLFGCKDEPHTLGGLALDGKLKGASVLVFNHLEHPGRRIDDETVHDIHLALGRKIGRKFFIIAPRGVFAFQQDYLDFEGVRYYALRIPYSIINELHHREFTALQQPNDETAVNDVVDAVGFDFIRPPQVEWQAGRAKRPGQWVEEAYLQIQTFESRAYLRGRDTRGGMETFSLLMLDFDYDGEVFDLDAVFYAHQLEANGWRAWFPAEGLGQQVMAVFIDIYGNEAREVIPRRNLLLTYPQNRLKIKN
jgi:hypothetical protein